jgi:hypothetical protein
MKLKDYAAKINELAEKFPEFEVVYATDDEGNDFKYVVCAPSAGFFKEGDFSNLSKKPNAVCIN